MNRRHVPDILALCLLVTSTVALSARFNSSAAFERPIHFSILTLLSTGGFLSALARWTGAESPTTRQASSLPPVPLRTSPKRPHAVATRAVIFNIIDRLRPAPGLHTLLVVCITGRVILFWRVIRTIQCSLDGLHAFLPLVLAVFEAASHGSLRILGKYNGNTALPRPAGLGHHPRSFARYIALAVGWGWSAVEAYRTSGCAASAICPPGWKWEPLIHLAQILVVFLDAAILICVSRYLQEHEPAAPVYEVVSSAFLYSSCLLALLAILSLYNATNIVWAFRIHTIGVRALAFDAFFLSSALLSGVFLLSAVHPCTIAVIVTALALLAHKSSGMLEPTAGLESSDSWTGTFIAMLCVGALLNFEGDMPLATRPSGEVLYRRGLLMVLFMVLLSVLVVAYIAEDPEPDAMPSGRHAITNLMESLRGGSESWIVHATQSTTFEDAVVEYKRRYGIPPPPRFDKWYEFAVSRNSTIIDNFDQINSDLRPFWGVQPSLIRERTAHLLEYPWLSMGGLRIHGGNVELSPHTPGTHAWMMEANAAMISPFAQWLPDMDLAFNLNDESRMAIPFRDMRSLNAAAHQSRSHLAQVDSSRLAGFEGPDQGSQLWSDMFIQADGGQSDKTRSPYFTDNIRRQIFYDVVTPTCPPDTIAQTSVWWNKKAFCPACSTGHTITTSRLRLVSDWTAAGDLCHQPDLAYLHGFLASPAPMTSTQTMFPIFSQSRTSGFSDILVPSPWNFRGKTTYDEADDVPWEEKENALFWRGASSDGFAASGLWPGFLRARFVHAAQRVALADNNLPWMDDLERLGFAINVSFVGEFKKCHEGDCALERDTFYQPANRKGQPQNGDSPLPVPFGEHWRFRHLIDLDGAGFSGRFLPFLQSRSLVYRAALFRTWFDERVHAWHHYVPLDLRLGKGLWGVVDFFAGRRGERLGQQIAEDGREWAGKVLRPEDMQVYMFRLLLEWGRVVQSSREQTGFYQPETD